MRRKATLHEFKPLEIHGHSRRTMHITRTDRLKLKRGHPWTATVTNQDDGRVFIVRGASCDKPGCLCDARVLRELKPEPEVQGEVLSEGL
jgi:hypothetical protein